MLPDWHQSPHLYRLSAFRFAAISVSQRSPACRQRTIEQRSRGTHPPAMADAAGFHLDPIYSIVRNPVRTQLAHSNRLGRRQTASERGYPGQGTASAVIYAQSRQSMWMQTASEWRAHRCPAASACRTRAPAQMNTASPYVSSSAAAEDPSRLSRHAEAHMPHCKHSSLHHIAGSRCSVALREGHQAMTYLMGLCHKLKVWSLPRWHPLDMLPGRTHCSSSHFSAVLRTCTCGSHTEPLCTLCRHSDEHHLA